MDESAEAEEKQRVYKSPVREETQALGIAVTNQHLKYIFIFISKQYI